MNVTTHFPQHLHWDASQLASAVPLRLSETFQFDATRVAADLSSANGGRDVRPAPRHAYLASSQFPGRFDLR
jgi:hypothetical protein